MRVSSTIAGFAAACVTLALALALTACGGDSNDRDEIAAVLEHMRDVQTSGNAEEACAEVYVIQEPEGEAEPEGGGEEAKGEPEEGEAVADEAGGNTEGDGDGAQEPAEIGDEGEGGGAELADCERAFAVVTARLNAEVTDLSTDVGAIEIDGESATATVHTTLTRADGSTLSRDVPYVLVSTPDGWRIRISDEG